MSKKILVIDDETSIQKTVEGILIDEGYKAMTASSGEEGLELIRAERPDIVLLDIWMPEMDGLEALTRIKNQWPDLTVIMMSGHGTIETAVRATKLGAFDFIEKPLSLERLLVMMQNAANVQDLARENQALRRQISKQKQLIGQSSALTKIKELIKQVAPTTGSVLITGENGSGKELIANSIHALSPRFNKPFVEVNCAAIPEELIESELFGHEKGAFTGATQLRRGKFDLANGGTLFLDEIGDMSLKTQSKILRILQEQKFERVGGQQSITTDVRVVAATNKDLKEEIKKGTFREDLYYRLNVVPFFVPPLRERKEDIQPLAEHFLNEFSQAHGKKLRALASESLQALINYSWPGNVRELKNVIERVMILTSEADDGKSIQPADLLNHIENEFHTEASTKSSTLREARHDFEKDFIVKTLKDQGWNVSKAATVLGIERSHLHKKIKSMGIEIDDLKTSN